MGEGKTYDWRALAEGVRQILSGKKPEELGDVGLSTALILNNLVTREEVNKPCRTCGKPQHDYSWWKVLPAGRLLVAALDDVVPPEARADG
jgi:hypothetical protein